MTVKTAAVDPSHLQACLPGLGRPAVQQLQACARLRCRLDALLAAAHPLPPLPDDCSAPATRLALARSETILDAGRLMGSAWHATSIRLCVDRIQVASLVERIGAPARLFALRHADLAIAPGEPMVPDDLAAVILLTAEVCLASWLVALPSGARERATLKLPARLVVAGASDPRVTPLVARAAEAVLADA